MGWVGLEVCPAPVLLQSGALPVTLTGKLTYQGIVAPPHGAAGQTLKGMQFAAKKQPHPKHGHVHCSSCRWWGKVMLVGGSGTPVPLLTAAAPAPARPNC